jgi:hypothetical protein
MKHGRFFDAFCGVAAFSLAWVVTHAALPNCLQLGFCAMRVADKIALGIGILLAIAGLACIVRMLLPARHRETLTWLSLW